MARAARRSAVVVLLAATFASLQAFAALSGLSRRQGLAFLPGLDETEKP